MNNNNNHEVLGLVVPTNEPKIAFAYLLSTLHNLREVAPLATILFNFQKPWDDKLITEALEICHREGFETRHTFNEYIIPEKGYVPFNKIRYDAAALMPEAEFFMLMDDDFSFLPRSASYQKSAGEQLLDIISYLVSYPDCGFVMLKGRLYLNEVPKYMITPALTLENRYITDKGIILRNFNPEEGLVVPNSAVGLYGSDEEKVACGWRLKHNYYPAVINRCRIKHYENSVNNSQEGIAIPGEDMYKWNSKRILDENTNKWMKENIYSEFNNRGWRITALIDPEEYSGIDLQDDLIRASYSVDTSKARGSKEVIIDSILDKINLVENNSILEEELG